MSNNSVKTILKHISSNGIEAKVIETNKGFALIVRDTEAGELVTRADSADLSVILARFNKFQVSSI